jgi:uncharacterized membrane protein YagU involved in acid resistance
MNRVDIAASAVHYTTGLLWGPLYGCLRRFSGMKPLGAAFVTGASMSLLIDETLTPALGFAAPSREHPTATHLRDFAGHLAFGFVLAGVAEALYRATPETLKAA